MVFYKHDFLQVILLVGVFLSGFIPKQGIAQVDISEKTRNMYDKAKMLLDQGKESKAEKLFTKLVEREQHGRSLFQLSKIESGQNKSTAMLLSKVITARRLMQEELTWLQQNQGNDHDLLNLSELISEADDLIHSLGGLTPEELLAKENDNFIHVNSTAVYSDSATQSRGITENELSVGNDGSILVNNQEIIFFPKDSISTFFKINENLPKETRLPTDKELETIITTLLSNKEGKQILLNLNWLNRPTLRIVSNQLFYDDENNQLVKGLRLKKRDLSLETADIEPGDSAIAILIVTH
jgi:hypothetical protein